MQRTHAVGTQRQAISPCRPVPSWQRAWLQPLGPLAAGLAAARAGLVDHGRRPLAAGLGANRLDDHGLHGSLAAAGFVWRRQCQRFAGGLAAVVLQPVCLPPQFLRVLAGLFWQQSLPQTFAGGLARAGGCRRGAAAFWPEPFGCSFASDLAAFWADFLSARSVAAVERTAWRHPASGALACRPQLFQAVVLANGGLHDVRHGRACSRLMIHSPLSSPSIRGLGKPASLTASRTLEASALVWRLEVPDATITRSNSGDRCSVLKTWMSCAFTSSRPSTMARWSLATSFWPRFPDLVDVVIRQ